MKRQPDGSILFSPHDLINFMSSQFTTWMDRRRLEDPSLIPDQDDQGTQILQKKGLEHERNFLDELINSGKRTFVVSDGDTAVDETIQAMRDGYDIVFQAKLESVPFGGIADFLVKTAGVSNLGDWHYEVWDTKLARENRVEFMMQLCCYADMLHDLQGRLPRVVAIALGNGVIDERRTLDFYSYYLHAKNRFIQHMETIDLRVEPEEIVLPPFGRWNTYGQTILDRRDDLGQVANIRKAQVKRLGESGITTMTALAESDVVIRRMRMETVDALRQQAQLQIASKGLAIPKIAFLDRQPRRGFAVLPPSHELDVFFDMEGYPHVEGGLEYLFGASFRNDKNEMCFEHWWAHTREAEKIAFEQFVDWIIERWRNSDGKMHIYHYASYEVSAIRRLMQRHVTREVEVDDLLRGEAFVDLYQIVRQAIRVGEPRYSIKNIEHLYRGKRQGDVSTAVDSIVFYERWREFEQQQTLDDILSYNKVDCDSTLELTDWLRERQRDAGIEYEPKPPVVAREEQPKGGSSSKVRCAELAAELRDKQTTFTNEEDAALNELISHLLQFHEREERPLWWQLYDRAAKNHDELVDDADSLGFLKRTATPRVEPDGRRRAFLYEYEFDATQESSIKQGSKCIFSHDTTLKCTVESIDRISGLIELRTTAKDLPLITSLLPDEYVNADVLRDSLFEVGVAWRDGKPLPTALVDFLRRRKPRLRGKNYGDVFFVDDCDVVSQSIDTVVSLDNSTLCVQGPPGCGKTYIGAEMICALLQQGRKIGITSNSHKAIENLALAVDKRAHELGIEFSGVRKSDDAFPFRRIVSVKDAETAFTTDGITLFAGTAWFFSHPSAVGKLDYLFVDEAGQVSLANLAAMSRCAKNLVLLGDQMQLDQPLKGTHPKDSGRSTLDYYVGNHATIPPDTGIFLGTTWRMHPDVCSLISEVVYEGRLHPQSMTAKRKLILPSRLLKHIDRPAGILFNPVAHQGNAQHCDEEIERISELIDELRRCKITNEKGIERQFTEADILVIAPYNQQVRRLRERLPQSVAVGTVDKFQGQEAAVAILSMCSSDANESPRGISFLFSRNRLNVAISRARVMAIVVGSPHLMRTECATIDAMRLVNFYCRIAEVGAMQMANA